MHESIIYLANFVPWVTQGNIIGVSKQHNFFYTKPFILLLLCQDISENNNFDNFIGCLWKLGQNI